MRRAVNGLIRTKGLVKKSKLEQYLGCNSIEFKTYMESLWRPGMSWDNYGNVYGQWSLDHTIPLTFAKTAEEMYSLSHYTNIKPMWAHLNMVKKDKSPEEWSAYKAQNGIDEAIPPRPPTMP